MKIGIATSNGEYFALEVLDNEEVLNVKVLANAETGIKVEEIILLFNGQELKDSDKLNEKGVKDDDVLMAQRRVLVQPSAPASGPHVAPDVRSIISGITSGVRNALHGGGRAQPTPPPAAATSTSPSDLSRMRQQIMSNSILWSQIQQRDPELADAIARNDLSRMGMLLQERERRAAMARRHAQGMPPGSGMAADHMDIDPDSAEGQRRIEEAIRQENVEQNMENAIEHLPESFAKVVMLYINATVNGTPIKAFVDSGAQQTIMSESCARRCSVLRLIDHRFSGVAQGVGTAKILGRVHLAPIQIGKSYFPCSFTILEDQGIDFLLGLDFLRRFQCSIDLKSNCLRIGDESVEFLPEKDIPVKERMNELSESQLKQLEDREVKEAMAESAKSASPQRPIAPSQAPAQTNPKLVFPEEAVTQLMALGPFPRPVVLNALEAAGGNVDVAAGILLGQ